MARIRSPNYPAISLREATDRLHQLFNKAQNRPISREQAAEAMGYDGLHGGSLGTISALLKYGLLDKENGQVRVTERGMSIVAPHDENERQAAINQAAFAPVLFDELRERFLGAVPNDDKLRSYLLRKGFTSSALDKVVRSFRETMDLVTAGAREYGGDSKPLKAETMPTPQQDREIHDSQPLPPVRGAPFRVSFEGDAIEVTGHLTTPEEVDKLVKALQINKAMITPIRGAMDTEYTDDDEGRAARERDRKLAEQIFDEDGT